MKFLDLSSLNVVDGMKCPGYFAVSWAVAYWLKETFQLDLKTLRTHMLFSPDNTTSGVYVYLTPEQEMLMRLKFQ
jgi:hypothetical protein